MATIYNSDVTKGLQESAKIQIARDRVPNQLAEKIVPVLNCNPKRLTNFIVTNSGNGTIHTCATNKDTYITALISEASNKTASQDSVHTLSVVPKGQVATIISSTSFSTSALIDVAGKAVSVTLPNPLLLERGSTIISAGTNINARRNVVFGYTVED